MDCKPPPRDEKRQILTAIVSPRPWAHLASAFDEQVGREGAIHLDGASFLSLFVVVVVRVDRPDGATVLPILSYAVHGSLRCQH